MILAGSGGIYEGLLIILVMILIFNGLKRQKIMNKVDANLENQLPNPTVSQNQTKNHQKEGDYVDFEEIED